jgi:16S rRNA (cytosine1402-N4)-methyltransferase
MNIMSDSPAPEQVPTPQHKRRVRYSGKNPRRFEDKYKERNPELYPEAVAKVLASGKTPAGSHRPIMVAEILEILNPQPSEVVVDATLGYGGHARALLPKLQPGGRLIGLDVDPIELPKTEARLRALGFGPETFVVYRSNFAGLPKILAAEQLPGVDMILADPGVSSMQLDDPGRGFSVKFAGPLDMRMNPQRGQPAFMLLQRISAEDLAMMLEENADESQAATLAGVLAGQAFPTTTALAKAIRGALLRKVMDDEIDNSIRRVFQALRITVNDEFSALDSFLRNLPNCLNPGGRAAVLTFHSGEDRRVKKAFETGLQGGLYADITEEVIRPTPAERRDNPRSSSAKLRWARKAA